MLSTSVMNLSVLLYLLNFCQCGSNMKVAVIGAGPAGLCTAHYLKKYIPDAEVEVFEIADDVGGAWRYTENTENDEHGLPPMTVMYKNLRTNLPKQLMEFPDFSIPKEYKSFMGHDEYFEYLNNYTNHFDLKNMIKFRHLVTNVYPKNEAWILKYKDLKNNIDGEDCFNYVFVCNGHNYKPLTPKIEGQDLFQGIQMHSYKYRRPEKFANKNVLIIGSGPSGMDISVDLIPTSKKIFFSHHTKIKSPYPENVIFKPDVKKFTTNSAIFTDETEENIDAIIYCTGYSYSYDFLDDRSGVSVYDMKTVHPIYMHIVNIEHPTMFFIGLPQQVAIIPLIDIQARYTIALIMNNFTLPSKEKMLELMENYYTERKNDNTKKRPFSHSLTFTEPQYYEELTKEAGIEGYPPVLQKIKIKTGKMKLTNVFTYRNCDFEILDRENYILTHYLPSAPFGDRFLFS